MSTGGEAVDVGDRPQPGRSFCSETADPASKQPEAVESVNHSFTAHMPWIQKASGRGGGGVSCWVLFSYRPDYSTSLGISVHVNVKSV